MGSEENNINFTCEQAVALLEAERKICFLEQWINKFIDPQEMYNDLLRHILDNVRDINNAIRTALGDDMLGQILDMARREGGAMSRTALPIEFTDGPSRERLHEMVDEILLGNDEDAKRTVIFLLMTGTGTLKELKGRDHGR